MRIVALATTSAVVRLALYQTIQMTIFLLQCHQNASSSWGSQTYIEQEINEWLNDLENAVLLLWDEVQNLKLHSSMCDWNISSFCDTPHK